MVEKRTPMTLPGDGDLWVLGPDGEEKVSYRYLAPTAEQLAIFAADSAASNTIPQRMSSILNFLEDILANPNDLAVIRQRLRKRDDPLELSGLIGPLREMFEEQSGFPTLPPSGSTNSRGTTGRRSTGRVQPEE